MYRLGHIDGDLKFLHPLFQFNPRVQVHCSLSICRRICCGRRRWPRIATLGKGRPSENTAIAVLTQDDAAPVVVSPRREALFGELCFNQPDGAPHNVEFLPAVRVVSDAVGVAQAVIVSRSLQKLAECDRLDLRQAQRDRYYGRLSVSHGALQSRVLWLGLPSGCPPRRWPALFDVGYFVALLAV